MKHFVIILQAALLLIALTCSCTRERSTVVPDGKPVILDLDFGSEYIPTKSVLDDADIENKLTGLLVMLYRSSDGRFDKSFVIDGNRGRVTLLSGIEYDIFFLANVENPGRLPVPEFEGALEDLSYNIPSYESLNRNGIPACAKLMNVRLTMDSAVKVELIRLLAKVKVHVSHEGITGSGKNDASKFANLKLIVRQANSRLFPFNPGGSVPVSASDVMAQSDYEPEMAGDGEDFVLYVPENLQGQLLPDNLDPSLKNETELKSRGVDTDCLTYIEYTGNLNQSLAGYGGDLIYRFYLGSDNVGDFSIERNHIYDIELLLTSDSLYDPYWKVSRGENWNDKRVMKLLSATGSVIAEGATVVARPSKPGKIKLFMNTDGSSKNMYSPSSCCAYAYDNPGKLGLYWTSNIKSTDQYALTLPEQLKDSGVKLAFDNSSGTFTFEVEDENAVDDGAEFELEFLLKPGSAFHRHTVKLKVLPDCKVDIPSDQMYVAQKINITVTGAAGTYSAKVISGSQYVDVGTDGLSVYGKTVGTAKIRLSSTDPVNDNQIDFNLKVNELFVGFYVDAPRLYLDCDGSDRTIPLFFCSDKYGLDRLDDLEFDEEYLKKYYPATVTHNSSELPNIADFYEVNPYRMVAYIKKLESGGVRLLDHYDENLDIDVVTISYPCGKSFSFKFGTTQPFIPHDDEIGKIEADALVNGSSGSSHDYYFISRERSEILSWKYSGKMKAEFERLDDRNYRITFPYEEQRKYLAEDSGEQYVNAVMTNIHSGETVESPRQSLKVVGLFAAGLVLLPQGEKFADAKVQLCWLDNFREAVKAGKFVNTLSSTNCLGDVGNYLYPAVPLLDTTGDSSFRLGDCLDVPDIRTSDISYADIRDFISRSSISVNRLQGLQYSYLYDACSNRSFPSCYVKIVKSNVSGAWMGAYVPSGQSSGWVEYY